MRRRTRPRTTPRCTSTRSASRRSGRTSASGRFERYLRRAGVLTDEQAEEIEHEALELMRAGIAEAEAEPPADPALVFEHAYAAPPPSQADDLAELRRILGRELSASWSRP